jgi:hypothetical protein
MAGFRQADGIFAADLRAAGRDRAYDDAYFDRFLATARPILERQLAASVGAAAAVVVGAWEAAGRPSLPLADSSKGPLTTRSRR